MKNKTIIILFLISIYSFMIISMIDEQKEISYSERRKLSTFPTYELSTDYSNKLEKYLLDQFPLRDDFRKIKSFFNFNILRKLENNNIYVYDNSIFKSNYPTNYKSINQYKEYVNHILSNTTINNRVYLLIIPDKNYYMDNDFYLNIDFDFLYHQMNDLEVSQIDIRQLLNIYDYYETDTHWKQQNLDKVVKVLANKFQFPYEEISYKENYYHQFYGVYYGEAALRRKPEQLVYLTDDTIDSASVSYLENPTFHKVYNQEKLSKLDSYDVYLDGASSYIEIMNHQCQREKELILFRDSFGSSIAPLLIHYYKKITIIDNRYISSKFYLDKIKFTDQDVLIMNSTLLVNDSDTLKN